MSNSWTSEVDDGEGDNDSDDSEDEQRISVATFEKAVRGSGAVADIGVDDLEAGIGQVEDEDLLREGWLQADGERRGVIEEQIESIGGSVEGLEADDEDDVSDSDGPEDSADQEEVDSDDGSDSESDEENSSGGWGSSDEEDSEEDDNAEEAAEPSIESVEEIEDASPSSDEEPAEDKSTSRSTDSGGPPVPESAITADELRNRDRRWKVMAWGPPKQFKTHFAYTMPEPIAFIDTEGKADDIVRKFSDTTIQFWRPKEMTAEPDTKFRRVKKALDEALEWLDWYKENEGKTGTIVVDSMSLVWEWAQRHHKLENYPLKDPEEVSLSSNFQSSQESDWAVIKEYHNGEFRERITDSSYHFYWTAMQRVAFEDTFEDEDNRQIFEPKGEPNNDHKVDTILRARKDKERGKVGDLVGSNFSDNVFVGLKKPTFPRVRDAIERIETAESSENPESRSKISDEIDTETIIDYDPQMYTN